MRDLFVYLFKRSRIILSYAYTAAAASITLFPNFVLEKFLSAVHRTHNMRLSQTNLR